MAIDVAASVVSLIAENGSTDAIRLPLNAMKVQEVLFESAGLIMVTKVVTINVLHHFQT